MAVKILPGQQNIGVNEKGHIVKIDPNASAHYTSGNSNNLKYHYTTIAVQTNNTELKGLKQLHKSMRQAQRQYTFDINRQIYGTAPAPQPVDWTKYRVKPVKTKFLPGTWEPFFEWSVMPNLH